MSPYSGYTGQLRSSVYQPTELAIISKGVGNVSIHIVVCSQRHTFGYDAHCVEANK